MKTTTYSHTQINRKLCDALVTVRNDAKIGNAELFFVLLTCTVDSFVPYIRDKRTKESREQQEVLRELHGVATKVSSLMYPCSERGEKQ